MLKYKLDKAAHEKLDDGVKALYKVSGDDFILDVEGATSKDKIDEFRTNNNNLQSQLKSFDGIDIDKYKAMLETDRKVRDKELIDKGDFETLINERTNVLKSDYEAKLLASTQELDNIKGQQNGLITRYEIEGAAHKAFSVHKIQPQAQDAVMAQIKSMFVINNGSVVAMDGENIKTGADGNFTVSEFVSGQPEFMKVPSSGGAGKGSESQHSTNDGASKREAYSKLLAS